MEAHMTASGLGAQALFAITVAFELVEGGAAEFDRLIRENAALSVGLEPNCLRFDILTPEGKTEGPDVLLYEIYRDRAAFDFHLAADHYLAFDARSRHLVRKKTVMTFSVAENAKRPVST
jgi:(4S)-4-hydroxy-5-phosphonooxypentane-2,3-dione isomerase